MSTKYAKVPAGDYALEPATRSTRGTFSSWRIVLAYAAGLFSAFALRFVFFLSHPPPDLFAPFPPGSTDVHRYPPPSPSNVFPSLFPSDIGHAGPTPTGAEPALVATAPSLPIHSGAAHLLAPQTLANHSLRKTPFYDSEQPFDVFQHWGNLSPWFSVPRSVFGVDSPPEAPEGCRVTGMHLLHRHGARYPTGGASYGGPANFSFRLAQSESWKARGQLDFLNDWTYKLGEEILTPFGRQQLYDLGVSMRMKYGFLLHNFTESNTLPVFRTESQDRMLSSALNFALGFFGHPLDGKYQQLITIEEHGFNNTLAPSKTCTNSHDHAKGDRGTPYVRQWAEIYLRDALVRLRAQITGVDLVIEDAYTMQQLCAYETVALGYSKFCELFTPAEWEGFDYSVDLHFWYSSAFGSPVARGLGIGYVQELVARLSHTPISAHNSSTNATLADDPRTFPLGQSLYVDATHEVVVLNVLTALNLTSFAKDGPLPATHIPHNRAFRTAHLAPFATNVQFQLLSCNSTPDTQIRVIVNDGVVPLTGIRGCAESADGACPLPVFVAAMREIIGETDWAWACLGDWEVPPGTAWNTTTGAPPERS
ncbi:phosphoglycerate mutase-like protein [Trametes versicolor FP-101664 SS1]|uniref:phosphoglycerate mutase-like protein n=1 Tax=Trametes versicolor (strain FP-101664) TaxID=717944 RepID=UPI00046226FD|nr:phosphoglycerate mutase-like protein [Trametes versicolor FP-101664 SS1]EIW53780.1 phosphoglycerate mutase-like protein [Trametes versicolor FP-101664 SS1]